MKQVQEKRKRKPLDHILLAVLFTLICMGLMMVFSASAPSAFEEFGDSLHYFKRQLAWVLIGLVVLGITSCINFRAYKNMLPMLLGINLVLLILVAVVGTEVKGAQRWLGIGPFGIQPSELTKVVVVIYMASYLEKLQKQKQTFATVYLPPAIMVGIPLVLIILQPHFSAIMIIGVVCAAMMIVGGVKFRFFAPAFIAAGAGGTALAILEPYRLQRLVAFADPFADKLGDGWQIVQSLYAIGSGGLTGLGLSRSRQKHLYIPEPQNDFIYSILCEELGMIGAIFVILLFVILVWRCFVAAAHCRDTFGSLLAFGMGFLIIFQVLFNIGVATASVPPTGVPLPFFSAGGSSFLFQMIAMGIVLNVSRSTDF